MAVGCTKVQMDAKAKGETTFPIAADTKRKAQMSPEARGPVTVMLSEKG